MLTLRVKADVTKVSHFLTDFERHIPYATAVAINKIAFDIQTAERTNIGQTFKSPRPFTVRSVLVDRAVKQSLTATVYVRPEVARYLLPYETGGQHWLPGRGVTLMEPEHVGLDQYGQLRKGTTARLKAKRSVFVGPVQTKDGVVNGFWQRLKAKAGEPRLRLLIRFGDNREVTKRLGFQSRAARMVQAGFSQAFADAIDKALASAR